MFKKCKNNFGNTAIEYALLMFFIGLMCFSAYKITGTNIQTVFCQVSAALSNSEDCESEIIINNPKWLIDKTYIDPSLGGTASGWVCWACSSTNGEVGGINSSFEKQAKQVANALADFQKDHDIKMIYGVMDGNKPLTSYQDTYNALISASKGDTDIKNTGQNYGSIEVITSNGEAYWYNTDDKSFWDDGPKK